MMCNCGRDRESQRHFTCPNLPKPSPNQKSSTDLNDNIKWFLGTTNEAHAFENLCNHLKIHTFCIVRFLSFHLTH